MPLHKTKITRITIVFRIILRYREKPNKKTDQVQLRQNTTCGKRTRRDKERGRKCACINVAVVTLIMHQGHISQATHLRLDMKISKFMVHAWIKIRVRAWPKPLTLNVTLTPTMHVIKP